MRKILAFLGKHKFLSIFVALIIVAAGYFVWQKTSTKSQTTVVQTATVELGTLVVSVSESGTMASANRLPVTTQASGQVKQVFIKNGDTVTAGQKLIELSLDQTGQQRTASAWASYLSAQSSLNSANNTLYSLQSTMFTNWQKYMDTAQSSSYQDGNGSPNTANRTLTPFTIAYDNWLSGEAVYKNQQNVIAQSQASLNNAWLNYQGTSAVVTSPGAGVVSDIVLTPGMAITSTTNSSNVPNATTVGSIVTNNLPTATFNLSEVDVIKVKEGQRATLTLDALPNMTFTGKVIGINRSGVVTSNVSNYPVTIQFDTSPDNVLPNMSVSASIITQTKDNVLLIPSAAVKNNTVSVRRGNSVTIVTVTTGVTANSQTEITSGLSQGDVVEIVSTSGTTTTNRSTTTSPFGNLRFGGR